jgi:hypothetical protein
LVGTGEAFEAVDGVAALGGGLGDCEDVAAGRADCIVGGGLALRLAEKGCERGEGGKCEKYTYTRASWLGDSWIVYTLLGCTDLLLFSISKSQNIGPAGVRLIRSGTSQGLRHSRSSEAAQV